MSDPNSIYPRYTQFRVSYDSHNKSEPYIIEYQIDTQEKPEEWFMLPNGWGAATSFTYFSHAERYKADLEKWFLGKYVDSYKRHEEEQEQKKHAASQSHSE